MAIRELDQDTVTSIYNKFVFTAKPEASVLDKKTISTISNSLTSIQNIFNVLSASTYNIGKLNEYKTKREAQLNTEKTIEGSGPERVSSEPMTADFSLAVKGFGLLAKKFDELNEKLEQLDLSSSCDVIGGEAEAGEEDIDIDGKKRKRRGRGRGRTTRTRAPRMGGRGLGLAGRALGVLGVGLDVFNRLDEGQSLTQTAIGVGGSLLGATAGAKLGATLGSFAGPVGTVAGGLIGGLGGYFTGGFLADKAYTAVAKPELTETSYSSKLSDFIKGSISNVVQSAAMLSPVAAAIVGLGSNLYNSAFSDNGGELPPNAGVLDAIAKAEGTYGPNGYNTSLANGAYLPGGQEQNLTGKTLDEILQLQKYMLDNPRNRFDSSAMGRYQIVSTTLRAAAKGLNLDTKTTKFDEQTQDRMAMWIVKKQGFGAWEGFKKNPQALQVAQTALQEGRIKTPQAESGFVEKTDGVGIISNNFGQDRGTHRHGGVDISAPTGTPVAALQSGKVTRAGWSDTYGNVVYIQQDNGYEVRYAHLNEISSGITVGARVSATQILGTVGSTGRSTGPHLHIEIRKDGVPGNPYGVLKANPWVVGGKKKEAPRPDTKKFTKEYDGILLDPKKKKKPKVVIVEKPVYVPLSEARLKGPGIQPPQSLRAPSGRKLPYYIGN